MKTLIKLRIPSFLVAADTCGGLLWGFVHSASTEGRHRVTQRQGRARCKTDIGLNVTGVRNEANTIRIGDVQTTTFIAGIRGATAASGVTVIIGSDGHLGAIVSSRDFKDAIKPMDKASEAILGPQTGNLPLQARS